MITNDFINEIVELFEDGLTSEEIATEVNLHLDVVEVILARKGL